MDSQREKMTSTQPKNQRKSITDANLSHFKNIKDLQGTGILNIQFLVKADKGGSVAVKQEEINKIFQSIDHFKRMSQNPAKDEDDKFKYDESHISKIRLADLKQRMNLINPNYPVNDLNTLFQGRTDITSKDMFELLDQNEMLEDFDPLQEAMNIITNETGEINFDKLGSLMQQLGYGELDKKDKDILRECLDIDNDGRITDKDIKEVVGFINKKKYLS